jgi:hypothetical protein
MIELIVGAGCRHYIYIRRLSNMIDLDNSNKTCTCSVLTTDTFRSPLFPSHKTSLASYVHQVPDVFWVPKGYIKKDREVLLM